VVEASGAEMWDAWPVIFNGGSKAWLTLLFYPKKFALYRFIQKNIPKSVDSSAGFRILDVGCGTGASVIEMKKLFPQAEVCGIDVIQLQIDIANARLKEYATDARVEFYDGLSIPAEDNSVDVIYTSDVLGHVADVPKWLAELNRILKPNGILAMFSESKLGKHAYIRNYLSRRGLNVDPHQEFHISLFSKNELRALLVDSGFEIKKMYSTVWAKFLMHPDELYPALQSTSQFFILRFLNTILYWLKNKIKPVSLAVAEFYSLIEMYTIGRWVESQGYVILGKKSLDVARDK